MGERFWEIDFLRGSAVIMMVVFHFLYDLNYFKIYNVDIHTGFWYYFAIITASMFIFLVGISLTISYSGKANYRKYIIRGLKIFGLGVLATIATWLFLGEGFIVFGILHFIGLSIIFAYPFLRFKKVNILLGISFIILGIYLQTLVFGSPWFFWFGLKPQGFYTVDYFPLLPWFGLILLGLFFGNNLYSEGKRFFNIRDLSKNSLIRRFCFLGRHSLVIYILHQPILVAFFWLMLSFA